jgi:hypothetical protein
VPRFLGLCLAMCCCVLLNGCIFSAVTHGIGAVERAAGVGENFSTWKAQMPPIPAGRSRIVVYPGGRRSLVYSVTGVGKGGEQVFAVDRDVCEVLGDSFIFLDLPPGAHEISSEGVSQLFGYQKGKNRLSVSLARSSLTYIRIDKEGDPLWHHYVPKQVDAARAEAELAKLPLYRDGLTCRPNKAEDRKP